MKEKNNLLISDILLVQTWHSLGMLLHHQMKKNAGNTEWWHQCEIFWGYKACHFWINFWLVTTFFLFIMRSSNSFGKGAFKLCYLSRNNTQEETHYFGGINPSLTLCSDDNANMSSYCWNRTYQIILLELWTVISM